MDKDKKIKELEELVENLKAQIESYESIVKLMELIDRLKEDYINTFAEHKKIERINANKKTKKKDIN